MKIPLIFIAFHRGETGAIAACLTGLCIDPPCAPGITQEQNPPVQVSGVCPTLSYSKRQDF